jgi:hypothetical protein
MRITRIALCTGGAVAFPVAGRLQRIDRIDGVAGGNQRADPRPAIGGLDPDRDLVRVVVLAK